MKKLMVLDGNSIVNRAFYGVSQNLTTRSGQPTNAVLGFLNILNKLLEEEYPDALCVTFDRKAPTFRHLAYEGYKAQRKGMPEELASQLPILKDVLSAMNIPMYELDGWEADDLIGTISKKDTAAGWATVIVTGDKDSLQLVTDTATVKLVSTRMGRTTTRDMTPDAFREEYGFDPIHIIDLKALMGDASDNIPGVKGVGEKTAMALIQRYQTVDALYEAMPTPEMAPGVPAKPGVIKKLQEGEEQARMSYDLATIRCDAPIQFNPQDNLRREVDNARLYQLFLELEFSKLIDKYHLTAPQGEGAPRQEAMVEGTCTSEVVESAQRLQELLELWRGQDCVAVLPLPSLDVVCVECAPAENQGHAALLRSDRLEGYNEALKALFGPDIRKVVHGSKELCRALLAEGIAPEGIVFDTEVAAYLLAPTDGSYDLEKLGLTYYNQEFPKAAAYLSDGAFGPLADPTAPMAALLSHTALIRCLRDTLAERLGELGMDKLYTEIELPLCRVLAEMELEGFRIDRGALASFGEMLSGRIDRAQGSIYLLAGEEFNINSTQQLGHILFDNLGLPPVKKTKTGYSTNAEVLEKLRGKHPIIEEILEYRQLTKLKSTYADGLDKVIDPDGRIHTSFQNTVTATGRLSSTEPNLQNIPVRTELGAELRKMFVAGPGMVLVDADYSQIELRLLACMAGDQAMIDGFNSGADIHTITASQVFGVPQEEVTPLMRRSAKAVNFGIVYGISPFSLSQDIGVTVQQAKEYMDKYFAHYAGVRTYMDGVVEQAKKDGYVSTLFGRRRWVPELKSSNFNTRSFGERVALNAPIQGTAADIIKLAMIRVRDRLLRDSLKGRLVLQVHDELIVECPEEEAEAVCALVKEEMEAVVSLPVSLLADTGSGKTWAEAH
ncbi:DNA polymerase I [Pseudoflavonifractor sp. AF19-9AC]|uniref:DNA polymerase I n=1 Tax=Pseudoflavonifractor sp. AF19-9AC TaxID=2292244 RepID=UPI000E4F0CD3|nr:DNA polymerase I [Pseudoflavonifractor sp. AF19-9AC]RHR07415.1 DNA polymerase I [Pseudoflavonifractor sp. AF19-9AC]